MEEKKIKCIYGSCSDVVPFAMVPGSKSITNRAVLLAALAAGETVLEGAFLGGDFYDLAGALETLGITVTADENTRRVTVTGCGGKIEPTDKTVYVGNAGTAARFVTALLGCVPGEWSLDASEQMRKRPMAPLLDALKQMGCSVNCLGEDGHFPFRLSVPERRNNELTVDINSSSQFLSALLIAGAVTDDGMIIHIEGKHGMDYVKMTEEMIRQFGVDIPALSNDTYVLPGKTSYKSMNYAVEPDMSAACYFYASAAILGISAGVYGTNGLVLQGDRKFWKVLEDMGCTLSSGERGVIVTGPEGGKLKGVSVDMHSFSDQALTLAAIAPYADSRVSILNVGHIRGQECDRIAAIQNNLSSLGIECEVIDGDIHITPGNVMPAALETYGDHRVAMSFAVTGLRTEGISILDPKCTKKTFAEYFDVMDKFIDEVETK